MTEISHSSRQNSPSLSSANLGASAIDASRKVDPSLPRFDFVVNGEKMTLQPMSRDSEGRPQKGLRLFRNDLIAGRIYVNTGNGFFSDLGRCLNTQFGENRTNVLSKAQQAYQKLVLGGQGVVGRDHLHQRVDIIGLDTAQFYLARQFSDHPVTFTVKKTADGAQLLANGKNPQNISFKNFEQFKTHVTRYLNGVLGPDRDNARREVTAVWNDLGLANVTSAKRNSPVQIIDKKHAEITWPGHKLRFEKEKNGVTVQLDNREKVDLTFNGPETLKIKLAHYLDNTLGSTTLNQRPYLSNEIGDVYKELGLQESAQQVGSRVEKSVRASFRDKGSTIINLDEGRYDMKSLETPPTHLQILNDRNGEFYCLSFVQFAAEMMHGKGSAATLGLLGAEYAKDLNFKKVKGVEVTTIDDQSWKQARNDLVPGSIIRFETQQPQYTGPNKPLTHIGIVRPDGKIAHLIGSTLCIDDKNSITNNYKPRQIITRNDGVKPEPFDTQNSRSEFEAGSTPERLGAKIIEALPNLKGYGAGFVQEIVYQLNREKFETKIGTGSRGKPELRAELKEKTKLKLPKDWY